MFLQLCDKCQALCNFQYKILLTHKQLEMHSVGTQHCGYWYSGDQAISILNAY